MLVKLLLGLIFIEVMPCLHPIWIRNKHYSTFSKEDAVKELANKPSDLFRLHLAVPCGKCVECQRARRSEWFVRLTQEFVYQRKLGNKSVFITLTIKPDRYDEALKSPKDYIRDFFETIRKRYGSSVKHFMVCEFGSKSGRLHFHGVLFNFTQDYQDIHALASKFGYIWLAPLTVARSRYIVKYVSKDVGKEVSVNNQPLSKDVLSQLRRVYVSAGLGKYIGNMPRPSFAVRSWKYTSLASNVTYNYSIPRYYLDKYLSAIDKLRIQVSSVLHFNRNSAGNIILPEVEAFAQAVLSPRQYERAISPESLSRRARLYVQIVERASKLHCDPTPFFDLVTNVSRILKTQKPWLQFLQFLTPLTDTPVTTSLLT